MRPWVCTVTPTPADRMALSTTVERLARVQKCTRDSTMPSHARDDGLRDKLSLRTLDSNDQGSATNANAASISPPDIAVVARPDHPTKAPRSHTIDSSNSASPRMTWNPEWPLAPGITVQYQLSNTKPRQHYHDARADLTNV